VNPAAPAPLRLPSDAFPLLARQDIRCRRARLLARIRRRFETLDETFHLGPLRLPFTRVADPNKVLDEVAAREDRRERTTGERRDGESLHLPYWAELWESSIGLGQFLVDHWRELSPGAAASIRVLDLGCGMGLAGMVAAALGAHVLFADLEPDALLFAQLNTLAYARRVRTRRLNWRNDSLGETFDVILGADVVYERAQWDALEPFWRAHLEPNGVVLLGEPGRQTGAMFVEWIRERAWSMELVQQPLTDRGKVIRVMRLSL
jgi:predicted nicotinamide N-methyase